MSSVIAAEMVNSYSKAFRSCFVVFILTVSIYSFISYVQQSKFYSVYTKYQQTEPRQESNATAFGEAGLSQLQKQEALDNNVGGEYEVVLDDYYKGGVPEVALNFDPSYLTATDKKHVIDDHPKAEEKDVVQKVEWSKIVGPAMPATPSDLMRAIPALRLKMSHLDMFQTTPYYATRRNWMILSPEGQKRLVRDSPHELSRDQPYADRVARMREQCASLDASRAGFNRNEIDLSRFIYDDKRQVVMCVVPKNACTSWKRFFWYFMGNDDYATVSSSKLVLSKNLLPRLSSLKDKAAAFDRLANYTRFFVQREPYERLISAHNSKFTNRSATNSAYKRGMGRRAARIFLPKVFHGIPLRAFTGYDGRRRLEAFDRYKSLTDEQQKEAMGMVKVMVTGNIDFETFVKMIFAQSERRPRRTLDVHWRPQTSLCNPCAFDYDFVVDFHNLKHDSDRLLDYLQRNEANSERVHFPLNPNKVDLDLTRRTIQELPDSFVSKLHDIYADDFWTLSYDGAVDLSRNNT